MNKDLQFSHQEFFILRAPFLPDSIWTEYREHATALYANNTVDRWAARATAASKLFQNDAISEAIFLASQNLHSRLSSSLWETNTESGRKLLLAFERYLNRMCFRSTPFGLFSTVAHGKIVDTNKSDTYIKFAGNSTGQRKIRLDVGYLQALRDHVLSTYPKKFRYLSNRSIWNQAEKIKFTEWKEIPGGSRNYFSSEIDFHPIIQSIIFNCADESFVCSDIAEKISGQYPKVSSDVIKALIDDLVNAQILLPALSIDLLSHDPTVPLAKALLDIPECAGIATTLMTINKELSQLTDSSVNIIEFYRDINARLSNIFPVPANIPILRVDCFRRDPAFILDRSYCENFVNDLRILITRFGEQDLSLNSVASGFKEKYGKSMIPLSEMLDDLDFVNSFGVDFVPDSIRKFGIMDEAKNTKNYSASYGLRKFDQFLIERLIKFKDRTDHCAIKITRDDVLEWPMRGKEFSENIFTIMTLLPAEDPTKPYGKTWLQGISNSSIGTWSGRFSYGDSDLSQSLQSISDNTNSIDLDIIHAEICYLPSGAIGNVLNRPLIYSHRINLVEGDGHGSDFEIPLSDILVTVQNGELQIWSNKYSKRIIPHMTSAHSQDHPGNINAYSFLRSLELHPRYFVSFGWSNFFAQYSYLPRIEYENIILAPARWLVGPEDFEIKNSLSEQENKIEFSAYLRRIKVSNLVELKEFDNTLILNWSDELDLEQLFKSYKRFRKLILREVIGGNVESETSVKLVRHEVLFPINIANSTNDTKYQKKIHDDPSTILAKREIRDLSKVAMSEVIYVKIYLPEIDMDRFLTEECADLITRMRSQDLMQDWFFIRYADPKPHVRLRIFLNNSKQVSRVVQEIVSLLESLSEHQRIESYCFSQYEREIVRYGGPDLMKLSEKLFTLDSDISLAIISLDKRNVSRIKLAVWSCHSLLSDFGYDLKTCHRIANDRALNYRTEFRIGSHQRDLMSTEYRKNSKEFNSLIHGGNESSSDIKSLELISEVVRKKRVAVFDEAKIVDGALLTSKNFESVIHSHMHMICIRLMETSPRAHEVVVYDTLERMYRAALGRSKFSPIKMELI